MMDQAANWLVEGIKESCASHEKYFEAEELLTAMALDVIAQAAFG